MIPPKIPENESERLSVLHSLNILDSETEERFNRITRIAQKLFDMPIVLISLVDANRQWFKSVRGLDGQEAPRDTSFCGHAILSNNIMVIQDATQDVRFFDNPFVTGDPNVRFYLGCPLNVKGYNMGTLCLIDNKPRDFEEKDLAIVRDLADMVRLEMELVQSSTTDELTGLSNRRGFVLIADHLFKSCQEKERNISLLFFDLDKFKYINDTFGHAEGDKVLRYFSEKLLHNFRDSDVVARLGGDEFCVICSDLSDKNIAGVIKRLEQSIENYNPQYSVQFSVGHMRYNAKKHASLLDFLSDADQLMYENKKHKKGL